MSPSHDMPLAGFVLGSTSSFSLLASDAAGMVAERGSRFVFLFWVLSRHLGT